MKKSQIECTACYRAGWNMSKEYTASCSYRGLGRATFLSLHGNRHTIHKGTHTYTYERAHIHMHTHAHTHALTEAHICAYEHSCFDRRAPDIYSVRRLGGSLQLRSEGNRSWGQGRTWTIHEFFTYGRSKGWGKNS